MKREWNININGRPHSVVYSTGFGMNITVDGEKTKLKTSNWFVNMVDHAFRLDGVECHLVAMGNKVDLAVDDIFEGSKEAYKPLNTIPQWVTALAIVSAILGIFLNGAIGVAIGALLGAWYISSGYKGKSSSTIIINFVIGLVIQGAFFFLVAFMIS